PSSTVSSSVVPCSSKTCSVGAVSGNTRSARWRCPTTRPCKGSCWSRRPSRSFSTWPSISSTSRSIRAFRTDAMGGIKGVREALRYLAYYVRQNRGAQIGFAIVGVMLLLVLVAPLLATHNPREANPADFLQPPNREHWFGTDATGLDIYSRVLYAPRIDMVI